MRRTITGVSSGATATVHRVITHAGTPGTADAEGYLVLTSVAGGPFTQNEVLQIGAQTIADVVSGEINNTFAFSVGGQYRFHNHNFFGGSATYRTYGVNGIEPGF